MSAAIALTGVTKSFGSVTAVDRLDLTVPTGGLYGFIGPNGAGKTTTLRVIMSILFADSGGLSVLGGQSALDAKDRIGYLPEERGVYRKMRVGAFLAYMARLKGVAEADVSTRVSMGLERVCLTGVENTRCEALSKGMLQKVQLVAAILHEPELLILDEPFSGLDPVNMRLLRDLVREEHRRGATILFSTHVMVQAEEICEHIVMMHRGRKVMDDSLAAIHERHDPRAIRLEPLDPQADTTQLSTIPGVKVVTVRPGGYQIELGADVDPGDVMRAVTRAVTPARVEFQRPTLEDVFVQIATDTPRPGAEAM